MYISIEDINAIITEYHRSQKMTARIFNKKEEIVNLQSFLSSLKKKKEVLNDEEIIQLLDIIIKSLTSLKEGDAARSVFVNLLTIISNKENIAKHEKEKEQRDIVFFNVVKLLKQTNLLNTTTLKWSTSLSFNKLKYLDFALSNLTSKYKKIDAAYLPVLLARYEGKPSYRLSLQGASYPDNIQQILGWGQPDYKNEILLELANTFLGESVLREKCTILDKISSFYYKKCCKLSFVGPGGKSYDDINIFFQRLIDLELLTSDNLNNILLSSIYNNDIDNIDLISALDPITDSLNVERIRNKIQDAEFNFLFYKNFNVLIKLLTADKAMRNSVFKIKFDKNQLKQLLQIINDYLPLLLDHTSANDCYKAILILKQNEMFTEKNIKLIKDEDNIYLTKRLPTNGNFYNTTMIIQDPFFIVQFDKHGVRKNILSLSDFSERLHPLEYRILSRMHNECLKIRLQPNEVRSIKREVPDLLGGRLLHLVTDKGGQLHINTAEAKAEIIVCLQHNNLLTPDNLTAIREHSRLDYCIEVLNRITNNRNLVLTQMIFNSILRHAKSLIHTDFFDNIPNHLLTQPVLERVMQICEEAQGDNLIATTRLTAYANQLLGRNVVAEQEGINYGQSTHNTEVHKSVSESAIKLKERYGKQIESPHALDDVITEIITWATTFPDEDPVNLVNASFTETTRMLIEDTLEVVEGVKASKKLYVPLEAKLAAAKRAIFNRGVLNLNYTDKESGITMREMFALYWLAIHDNKARSPFVTLEAAKHIFADALYQTQREYGFLEHPPKSETYYEVGGKDKPSCPGGTFNKPADRFTSVLPSLVEVRMANKALAGLALLAKVRNYALLRLQEWQKTMDPKDFNKILDDIKNPSISTEAIWLHIQEKIHEEMKQFLSAFANDKTSLHAFVEETGRDTHIDPAELEKLRMPEHLSNEKESEGKEKISDNDEKINPSISQSGFFAVQDNAKESVNTEYTNVNTEYTKQNELLKTLHLERMNKVEEKQSERVPEMKESTQEEIEETRPDVSPAPVVAAVASMSEKEEIEEPQSEISTAAVTPAVEPVTSISEKETDNLASLQSDLLRWLNASEKKMKELYQSIISSKKVIPFNREFDAARYFITDLTIRLEELMTQTNSIDRDVLYLKLRNKKIKLHVNNVDDVNAAIKHFLDDYKTLDKVSKSYLDSLVKILNKYLISIAPKLKDHNKYAAKFFRTSQTAEKVSNDGLINKKTKPTT